MIRLTLAALAALLPVRIVAQSCPASQDPVTQTAGSGYVVRLNGDSVSFHTAQHVAQGRAEKLKAANPAATVTYTIRSEWRVVCVVTIAAPPVVTPPIQPPPVQPPPPSTPPTNPPAGPVWFDDAFAHGGICSRAPSVGGFGWGALSTGSGYDGRPDSIRVGVNPRSPSGCSLEFVHQGGPILTDDSWVEQRFRLGLVGGQPVREVFVGMIWEHDSSYIHREPGGADNNKILRLWDKEYQGSVVHLGMSNLAVQATATTGVSQMIVEYMCTVAPCGPSSGTGTGNFGTGPWNRTFRAGSVDTVGFYARTASAVGAPDGIIRVWWNRQLVYNRTDLRLANNSTVAGAFNGFGNGYLPGWANSGYPWRTVQRLRRFVLAPAPLAEFLPQ